MVCISCSAKNSDPAFSKQTELNHPVSVFMEAAAILCFEVIALEQGNCLSFREINVTSVCPLHQQRPYEQIEVRGKMTQEFYTARGHKNSFVNNADIS